LITEEFIFTWEDFVEDELNKKLDIDWDAWINKPGLPPVILDFSS
jgi:hypothetical protein